jgi:hypothetical protein
MDTEAYLKQLAEQQKANKKAELEQTKQDALMEISKEESQIVPAYAKQKQSANVQSQIAAKNFAEYLSNRGQTSQGIATQYEMSRQNTLGNTLSYINTAENQATQNIADKRSITEKNYADNLTNYNNQLDLQLTQNIANAKAAEQEALAKQQQQDFENQMAIAKYNLSVNKANKSGSPKQNIPTGTQALIGGKAKYWDGKKWNDIDYGATTKKVSTKDGLKTITENVTTYDRAKQQKWNQKDYWMIPGSANQVQITIGGKQKTRQLWENRSSGTYSIIINDNPIDLTADGLSSAYKSGILSKKQLNELKQATGIK